MRLAPVRQAALPAVLDLLPESHRIHVHRRGLAPDRNRTELLHFDAIADGSAGRAIDQYGPLGNLGVRLEPGRRLTVSPMQV